MKRDSEVVKVEKSYVHALACASDGNDWIFSGRPWGLNAREVSSNEVHQLMMHRKSPVEERCCSKKRSFLIQLVPDLMSDDTRETRR
jgi:hypothetical protein